jgi:hypothetical protein
LLASGLARKNVWAMSDGSLRLLAVYLGGRAPKCNIELHDVVFVAGPSIEETYLQLLDKWFGNPLQMHIDSWLELGVIDGWRVTLRPEPSASPHKLYFINLGAYLPGQFTELHANAFVVATSGQEVNQRAKRDLLRDTDSLHTDDLYEIDDCLEIEEVDGLHVHLEPTDDRPPFEPRNGYHKIPKDVTDAFAARRGLTPN